MASYLDYPNPLDAAAAAGMLPTLGAMLAGGDAAPAARTAKQVAARMTKFLAANDHNALVALHAPDVVMVIPFAPPGVPTRSAGRDHLIARLEAVAPARRFDRADAINLLETSDPDVVVAAYTLHGSVTATSRPFSLTYVMVITVRDGLIVHSRDYGNPLATAELLREVGLAHGD